MSISRQETLQRLRKVLRAVREYYGPRDKTFSISAQNHILNQVRNSKDATDENSILALKTLQSLDTYVTSCLTHQGLIDKYMPYVDLTSKEKLRRTAHVVGLELPDVPKPERQAPTAKTEN